jgi:hypothetical protein
MEEEHGGDDGPFADLDKVNKANVAARLKEIKGDADGSEARVQADRGGGDSGGLGGRKACFSLLHEEW